MKSYKLRAEGLGDVLNLFKIIKIENYTIEGFNPFPDVVFTFKTAESKKAMMAKIEQLDDSHVMLDTLETEAKYTGNRDKEEEEEIIDNKAIIKNHVVEMLEFSHKNMVEKIDKALNSGAVDTEEWNSEQNGSLVLPKTVMVALLENEVYQYYGRGTMVEKQVKKDAKNILYFL